MLITPYRFLILLSVLNWSSVLHSVTIDSDKKSDHLWRTGKLYGNRQRIREDEKSLKERSTTTLREVATRKAFGRSLSKLGFTVPASEIITSNDKRERRRNRDVTSTVAIANSGIPIREDGSALSQSSVASSSSLEGFVTTRHSKNRHRRRCKNRLGCVRSGNRSTASITNNGEDNDDENKNEQPNDYHPIPKQLTRNRNLEKQLLVENRSLALFRQEFDSLVGDAAPGHVVDPSSKEIGDILADTKSQRTQVVTETTPRILLKQIEKKDDNPPVEVRNVDKSIVMAVTKYEKRERAGEKNINDTLSSLKEKLNGLDDRSIKDRSQIPSFENSAKNSLNNRTNRYGSLQYEFDRTEEKRDFDRSQDEPKYEPRKTIHVKDNGNRDSLESTVLASMDLPMDDHTIIHGSLAVLLSRLFDTLKDATAMEKSRVILEDLDTTSNWFGSENSADDLCQKWLDSKDKLEKAFLGPLVYLPACPCQYPSSIFYEDKIWDEHQQKYFRWRDVNGDSERMDVYKSGATYCVRSLLSQGSGHAAAQHCCYDRQRRLLTRGSGAGTPNFVSPELSTELHERIDILPWRLCRGDFSRFNKVRPPNNDNHCKTNPDDDEYRRQINNTKYY